MGLRTCQDCDSPVSTSAKACPKCGAKPPKEGIGCVGAIVGLMVILGVGGLISGPEDKKEALTNTKISKPQTAAEKEKLIILALDEVGRKLATKSEHGAIKYSMSYKITTTEAPAYKSVFITSHPELMSFEDAARNPESKMKNLARTAAWEINFCSKEIKDIIQRYDIWIISGDLTNTSGEAQSIALCSN